MIRKAVSGLLSKKRFLALFLTVALVFSCVGCSEDSSVEDNGEYETSTTQEARSQEVESSPGTTPSSAVRGLSISVDNKTGLLNISRMTPEVVGEIGDSGVWTIFVYMCGTDLETNYGMGTGDIAEMCAASDSDNVRFVVETGGTYEWQNSAVESESIQRFVVQHGAVEAVDEQPRTSMGSSSTLSDFLLWGVENYASEHMGVVLWDHGGGSVTGICFDERENYDSLSLAELDEALYTYYEQRGRRFDFIGFDACLMGTVETANILATYADYMYGSEETEPGSGWDYTAIGDFLASNPDADGLMLGKVVCDSFLAACKAQNDDNLTTLSVIDLGNIDTLLDAFNIFASGMYNVSSNTAVRAEIIRAIEQADNFGGNNKSEGYTNMVDMGGIIAACAAYVDGASAALETLERTVVYSVSGQAHSSASGLSIYYPLSVQGSEELSLWSGVCVSPYYLSFVDRQNQSSVAGAGDTYDTYDDNQWFDDDGSWTWGWLFDDDDDYWNYLDDYEQTGESPYITFTSEPQLDENGTFWFELDEDGNYNAADVYAMIYMLSPDGEDIIELGETYDINGDWESGVFYDDFDGYWLSLPDGQNLATYIVEAAEDYTIYTSQILLNGEVTNLRLKLDYSEAEIVIEGAWDGIDEHGAASREITKLKDGDEIIPLYNAYALESDDELTYYGEEYIVSGEPEIYYDLLYDGDYYYCFCIDDIYGDYYLTDIASFYVEGDEVGFYVEE